jgi:ferredoxin
MNDRLRLWFPYLCGLSIVALMSVDAMYRFFGAGSASATEPAMTCHEAAMSGTAGSTMAGIPLPLYYSSIAAVLLVSFLLIERSAKKNGDTLTDESQQRGPRADLLSVAWIRRLVVHPATRVVMQLVVVGIFLLIIAAGLFGNQLPTKNIAPLLTWTIWWCGLIVLILYAGKAWCYVCPWDAIAGWAERLSFRTPRRRGFGLRLAWPKVLRNIWPATLMFVALTWLEIGFGVTMRPRATAWLALAILGMAFASAFIFDRKSFCRYGCLVGRISGLYALFSPVEVRAKDKDVCRSCPTKSCYKGNEDGDACPTFQFPAVMDQNTYCISCMECVKTCESDNIAVQLRPWGTDLALQTKVRSDEAYLALIMLALTGFHGLTMTASWGTMVDGLRGRFVIGEVVAFSLGMAAVMLGPILLYAVLVWVSRAAAAGTDVGYKEHFLRYAYALLPIALFYHIAHNSEHLLMEGQRIVSLVSDPFGLEWNLFGTATWDLGPMTSMQTLWIVQVLLVLIGHVYSLWASRHAASQLYSDSRAAMRSQIPMLVTMILFSIMSLWLLRQPMEMRMTWM